MQDFITREGVGSEKGCALAAAAAVDVSPLSRQEGVGGVCGAAVDWIFRKGGVEGIFRDFLLVLRILLKRC